MTYAGFLSLFLLLPLLILSLLLRWRLLDRQYLSATARLLLPVLLGMALWDHAAAVLGIWSWTPQQTWGPRLWLIPVEEYLFALLETLLLTMLVYTVYLWRDEGVRAFWRRNT